MKKSLFGAFRLWGYVLAPGFGALVSAPLAAQTSAVDSPSGIVTWAEGDPESDRVLRDGKVVKLIVHDSIAVGVSIVRTDKEMWVTISAVNRSARRFDLDPSAITLNVISPKAKSLSYRNPDDIAKSIRRRAEWGAMFATISGEMATKETTTEATTRSRTDAQANARATAQDSRGNYAWGSGVASATSNTMTQTTVTTTEPDVEARAEAARDAERMLAMAGTNAAAVLERALRANTLMPGKEISGVVFFERDKKAREVVVRIPVGQAVYEFPLSVQ